MEFLQALDLASKLPTPEYKELLEMGDGEGFLHHNETDSTKPPETKEPAAQTK